MLSNQPFFESLRDLLAHLEQIGKLQRLSRTVEKDWEIACLTRQVMSQPPERRYAILFEKVAGFETPVATTRLVLRASSTPSRSASHRAMDKSTNRRSMPGGCRRLRRRCSPSW